MIPPRRPSAPSTRINWPSRPSVPSTSSCTTTFQRGPWRGRSSFLAGTGGIGGSTSTKANAIGTSPESPTRLCTPWTGRASASRTDSTPSKSPFGGPCPCPFSTWTTIPPRSPPFPSSKTRASCTPRRFLPIPRFTPKSHRRRTTPLIRRTANPRRTRIWETNTSWPWRTIKSNSLRLIPIPLRNRPIRWGWRRSPRMVPWMRLPTRKLRFITTAEMEAETLLASITMPPTTTTRFIFRRWLLHRNLSRSPNRNRNCNRNRKSSCTASTNTPNPTSPHPPPPTPSRPSRPPPPPPENSSNPGRKTPVAGPRKNTNSSSPDWNSTENSGKRWRNTSRPAPRFRCGRMRKSILKSCRRIGRGKVRLACLERMA
mmetsp:Transcript_24354/g.51713  ORF Transcript_24354/g.51713 Transcript_24354/m.51713 type:complete len:371 (+) Transcript_24354:320-1432(+)